MDCGSDEDEEGFNAKDARGPCELEAAMEVATLEALVG